MSKETSSSRFPVRNALRTAQSEANENEFESSMNSVPFPPPRTPLNTIPDPSQYQKGVQEPQSDSKSEAPRAVRSSEKKPEAFDKIGNVGHSFGTPRDSGRSAKAQSEPNSAQSTPARSVSVGGSRAPQHTGGRRASYSRVYRGDLIPNSEFSTEVPHFELMEDASFWTDHNVQVLIRIRPLSTMERVSQGYGRCLKQESAHTLAWLGHPEARFTFDHIACETISQEKLFKAAGLPMVENCMSGYNSCMFAYGQTGSGKTYTMMGEIHELEGKLKDDCGITPRIFEYLFTRIREEEESRRNEKLSYSCKCSFLEIYNEQITDLLEPSSTNLQLREDVKNGVYVENLTEHNVRTVNDVVKLLIQGAANRKMAATHMNSESSRSHSVFTCTIESCWEKDSMPHFRFARLNLVDLAGSERQKSSGAEGDRLKEAANINKSLSTLGLVIMSLVDLAHGKHRHVPYRDSRLTFLLQDSLGGNSKTTIIANVSPSICSANETLSTLKFAQRAKLIQNDAKVNEDASGDVSALQRQIQQLKGQLSFVMNHHNFVRALPSCGPRFEESSLGDFAEGYDSSKERAATNSHNIQTLQNKKQLKCMEATLVGALRREKIAEAAVQKLEGQIEHMNHLVLQREEDAQRAKMLLRFREEKIKRLELLVDGSVSAEKYLMEENNALLEEIQLLQARIDRNPELSRFAFENIKLLEQLQVFHNFYEQGEREMLLAEVSNLRDQLLETLEGNRTFASGNGNQDSDAVKELENCRNMNSKLIREVDELRAELGKYLNCSQAAFDLVSDSISKDPKEFRQTDKYSLVETISIRSDSVDEMASYTLADDEGLQNNGHNMGDTSFLQPIDTQKGLTDARLLFEMMESEQVRLTKELQLMQGENHKYKELLSNKDKEVRQNVVKLENHSPDLGDLEKQNKDLLLEGVEDIDSDVLQAKLDKLTKDLEQARILNCQYQEDQASQLSRQCQVELVCEQVEAETTRTIIHLQEEVAALQLELHEKLSSMTRENARLQNSIAAKEEETRALCLEWERATLELTSFLVDGSRSLKDASSQIESISCSFPQVNFWITEHVERAARVCIEKEEMILLLQKSLEDAQKMVVEMELKLSSLKGATIALNETQQLENNESTEEAMQLSTLLKKKTNEVEMLESKLKDKEDQIVEAEKRANAAFLVMKWLSDCHKGACRNETEREYLLPKQAILTEIGLHQSSEIRDDANSLAPEDITAQVQLAQLELLESENVIHASYADTEKNVNALHVDICKASSAYIELVQILVGEINEMRKNFMELKENFKFPTSELLSLEAHKFSNFENQYHMLQQIREELVQTNERLNVIKDCINNNADEPCCQLTDEDLTEADGCCADWSMSNSDNSTETVASRNKMGASSSARCSRFPGNLTEQISEGGLVPPFDNQESETLKKHINSFHNEGITFCLRKELQMTFNAFNKIHVQLASLFNEKDFRGHFYAEGMRQVLPSFEMKMVEDETSCQTTRELVADEKNNCASSFLVKFEEAQETIKEADFILNALLKENENAKQLTGMYKQLGEELMVERASLIEEVEQLESSIHVKEKENKILQDQIHYNLKEIANSMSFLERYLLQMQRDVEELFKVMYSDVLSMGQDMMYCIGDLRSSLEDLCSEMMEKEFALFVLYLCHAGKNTIPSFNIEPGFLRVREQECHSVKHHLQKICLNDKNDVMGKGKTDVEEGDPSVEVTNLEEEELGLTRDNLMYENLALKKELERKEVLLGGLLFDFRLLQESASNTKDMKDQTEKLVLVLGQVRHELEKKTRHLDEMKVQQRKLEVHLADTENALFISNSKLEQAEETLDAMSVQNADLRVLLKDLYFKKSEAQNQLEEQKEVVKGLEKEILHLTSSMDKKLLISVTDIEDKLNRITSERDQLHEEVCSLNDKLGLAYALADENEAIAVEARQESEASKIYAEQKEEEVKILENSVEELESTVNVLEKKVYEMDEEVERQRLIRDSLELELQTLRQRFSIVENFTEANEEQISRLLDLKEAHNRIELLERERVEQDKELKQHKEYIAELLLHSEAQASQYQQKYKTLEAMVREVKSDLSNPTSTAEISDKNEKVSMRTRGSSSPFRCISSLVQQMNLEKDQELSMARFRIEELEALAASRQKEVCMLNTRLAAAESMTHDVIRDLLGVKLDMTNYANLMEKHEVQKLVEEAQHQTEGFLAKEQEILNLRNQIDVIIDERERCISDINKREAEILAAQMAVEHLQERDQLLSAQNEMLKMDKANLMRKVVDLDAIVKTLLGKQSTQLQQFQQASKIQQGNSSLKMGDTDFTKRLANSERLLLGVNDELKQYCKSSSSHHHEKNRHGSETKYSWKHKG